MAPARISFFTLLLMSATAFAQAPELVLPLGHSFSINAACFSPDGKYVVTASEDRTSRLWRVMDGRLLRELKEPEYVLQALFSPACAADPTGGKFIVTASGDNKVRIWETKTGRLLYILKGRTSSDALGNGGIAIFAGYSPDGKYIAVSSDAGLDQGELRIWNARTGTLFRSIRTGGRVASQPDFNHESRLVSFTVNDSIIKTWELATGKLIRTQQIEPELDDSSLLSSDGKLALVINERKIGKNESEFTVSVKESLTGSLISTLELTFNNTWDVYPEFSPDARYIITLENNMARLWETKTGKLFRTLKGHTDKSETSFFSRDGKYIIAYPWSEDDSIPQVWELSSAKINHQPGVKPYRIVTSFERFEEGYPIVVTWNDSISKKIPRTGALAKSFGDVFEISGDLKYVINAEGTWDNKAYLWDAPTGKLLKVISGHTGVIHTTHFSPDSKRILTAASDNTARIWQASNGKLLHELPGHSFMVRSADFSPATLADPAGGKYIVTTAGDHSIRVWETKTGKLVITLLGLEGNGYFSKLPSGYYQCTPDAAKLLHYVTQDLKVITFEQLDVKYNRPDKVLEAVGNTDTGLIRSYRKAWEKRIKKLGIDTSAFREGYNVPECDLVNRDTFSYEQNTGTLSLHIRGHDSAYQLERFNVWVNESPVYGQRGISLRRGYRNSFDTTVIIGLSQGENRIETSITNVNGTESYRMPLIVNGNPGEKQKERLHFIGIGIDKFADTIHNLQYSTKDIRDLSIKLKVKYKGDLIIDTLFNENVTISNIKALKKKLLHTTVNDKVIISYSGHGLLSKDYDYFLSTYSVNFDKPEEKGLPYDELENLLDSIPARKKLMLIDACHSGEVDKDEVTHYKAAKDSLAKQGTKGGELRYTGKSQVGMKNSFELMQSLFVNVGKSTGATIISAAAGTQFALERGDLKNGVFTYSILEAMDKNPNMRISELKRIVGERVEQLTNGLQKPTSRNETIASDWNLW